MFQRLLAACCVAALCVAPALAQNSKPAAPIQLQPVLPHAAPTKPGKVEPLAPPMPSMILSPREIVAKANAYFNSQTSFSAQFVQLSADGQRAEGELYVSKPGRMRFEYTKPPVLQIIADGTSVAIHDLKLHTQDVYFIQQTPLKFLLSNKIDLARDTKVLDVQSDADNIAIFIEDKATLGGTSRIKLIFDPGTFALKQWVVTDPQGYQTVVSLFNIDNSAKPDPELFKIENVPAQSNIRR